MNKVALVIPKPGQSAEMQRQGYIETLFALGWQVHVLDPKVKITCKNIIEDNDVGLILTCSRYGIRQLPIDCINDKGVMVAVDILPCNKENDCIGGVYNFAHKDEPDILAEIENLVLYTHLEPHLWNHYMDSWIGSSKITHIPMAANIFRCMPERVMTLTDVAMVANFGHRQLIMKNLIEPLFERILTLGYMHQVFGDAIWESAGISSNGPIVPDKNNIANIYASAKVCPNVHTHQRVTLQSDINQRSFEILLCGGTQVSDNPLSMKYLRDFVDVPNSKTDFIKTVVDLIENKNRDFDRIREAIEFVAQNHTYFNRLASMFESFGQEEYAAEILAAGSRMAFRHCQEMDTKLSAEQMETSNAN